MSISLLKTVVSRLVSAKVGVWGSAIIVLTSNNNANKVILPITPATLPEIAYPQNNETFNSIEYDMSVIGTLGLRSLSLDFLLPSVPDKYSFCNKFGSTADDVIKFLDNVQRDKIPMRIVIAYTNGSIYLNMACLVNSFSYSVDNVSDYHCKVDLVEYRMVNALGGVSS